MTAADIEYRGSRGTTAPCLDAVAVVLQERTGPDHAVLVSGPADDHGCRSHMLILVPELGPRVLVRDGFSSGYLGEGPRGLVDAILLLDSKRWDITELRITEDLFEAIADSRMTEEQLTTILDARREPVSEVLVRYVSREALEAVENRSPWDGRPVILPFAIIDRRILDLAYAFFADPDTVLHRGYRRLEDIVRERSGLNDHGARLFSRAFGTDQSPLVWDMHGEDSTVFAQLFVSAFSGFRNARAHRELEGSTPDLAVEFLQLNTLYLLRKLPRLGHS